MVVKCALCGGDMEIAGSVPDNVNIKCPHCGEYVRMSKPHRIEVPTGANLPRFVPNDSQGNQEPERRRPDLHVRRPSPTPSAPAAPSLPPPSPPPRSAKQNKGGSTDWIIYALLAVIVIGFGVYWLKRCGAGDELTSIEANLTSVRQETDVRQDADAELQRIKEEKRNQEEAEREKRRAEKAKRDAEREKERKEMALKAERERQSRKAVSKAELSFNGVESVFASDFPTGKRPFDFAEDCVFTVADETYVGARALYLLTVEDKQLKSVRRISQRNGAEDVEMDEFMRSTTNKIVLAKAESGPVWICGNTKMSELIKVPDSTGAYVPLPDFMGEALPVLNALRVVAPSVKYRISLKAKDGRGEIKLGIVEKEIDIQAIRSKIREQLTDRKLKTAGSGIKPPAMKKFKRTVAFYDGEIIKKEIGGLIKVPRHYVYHGSWQNRTTAEERWKELAKKAEEQDREELAVEAENQRRMEEYRSKTDAVFRNSKPTEGEVDAELAKYRLLIERSRTKLRSE